MPARGPLVSTLEERQKENGAQIGRRVGEHPSDRIPKCLEVIDPGTEPSLHECPTTGTETQSLPSRPPAPGATDDGGAVGPDGEAQAVWEPEGDPNPAWGVRGLPEEEEGRKNVLRWQEESVQSLVHPPLALGILLTPRRGVILLPCPHMAHRASHPSLHLDCSHTLSVSASVN